MRRSTPAGRVAALAAVLAVVAAPPARAQGAEAEELFVRGRDAMLRGDYDAGCPLLAESHRREAHLGVMFTLAECEWRWGKSARAYQHYDAFLRAYARPDAARGAANDERQRIATTRKGALALRVAFVTLLSPAPRPAGMVVTVDGEPLGEDALGVELPVEPGSVTVAVVNARGDAERVRLALSAGEHRTVMLAPPATSPGLAVTAPSAVTLEETRAPDAHRSPWVYVPAVIGVAAIGVGAVTGALVLSKKGGIDARCPDHRCDPTGLDEVDAARTLGRVSTAGFIVGGAGLVATTLLVLARPSASPAPPLAVGMAAGPRALGASVWGAW